MTWRSSSRRTACGSSSAARASSVRRGPARGLAAPATPRASPRPTTTSSRTLAAPPRADIVATVKSLDPEEICKQIVSQASYMWKVEEGDYRDDITVVVLTFPWLDSYEQSTSAPAAAEYTPES